jgi:hypothetical protein
MMNNRFAKRAFVRAALLVPLLLVMFSIAVPLGAEAGAASPMECIPREQCCKLCNAGKACGNTCISRAKNCHKGRGCACDADEVCP